MKLTKSKLKQLIKEELQNILVENNPTNWSDKDWWTLAEKIGIFDPYDDGFRNVAAVGGWKQRVLDAYNAGENWQRVLDAYDTGENWEETIAESLTDDEEKKKKKLEKDLEKLKHK